MGEFANLGEIVNTFGLKGEIRFLPGPDFCSGAFKDGKIYLVSSDMVRKLVEIEKFRKKGRTYVIKLNSLKSIEDAESVVGKRLELSTDGFDSASSEPGLPRRLIGMKVFLKNSELVGVVDDIFDSGAQDCLIVKGEKNFIIPYVPGIVTNVDYDNGRIEIDPPEGLLELEW